MIPLTEGTIDLGDEGKLSILETVGHASHHLSFHEPLTAECFPVMPLVLICPCDAVVPTTPPPFLLEPALTSLDKLIALNPTALYFSHFGKANNAANRLKAYKEQLKLWVKIAEEGERGLKF